MFLTLSIFHCLFERKSWVIKRDVSRFWTFPVSGLHVFDVPTQNRSFVFILCVLLSSLECGARRDMSDLRCTERVELGTYKLWYCQTGDVQNFQQTSWQYLTMFLWFVFFCWKKIDHKNTVKYCQKIFCKLFHLIYIFSVHFFSDRELVSPWYSIACSRRPHSELGTSKMQVWNWKSENVKVLFIKDFLSNKQWKIEKKTLFISGQMILNKRSLNIFGFPVSDLHFWRPWNHVSFSDNLHVSLFLWPNKTSKDIQNPNKKRS